MVNTDRDMLKFVEAMDAFVRLIVITVFATGAIQFAGFMRTSRNVQALPQYTVDLRRVDHLLPLIDTQIQNQNRSISIENILKMPPTYTSFNDLMQSARPAMQRLRELAKKRYQQAEVATMQLNRIRRKYHEGPIIQPDGSSSRVLLRI